MRRKEVFFGEMSVGDCFVRSAKEGRFDNSTSGRPPLYMKTDVNSAVFLPTGKTHALAVDEIVKSTNIEIKEV